MGTWGFDTFDNDTAGDWAFGLEDAADLSYVGDTFERVLASEDEYLDVDDACEGLAACEVVARLKKLAEQARGDVGDYNRIGTGARFFDPQPRRPDVGKWATR